MSENLFDELRNLPKSRTGLRIIAERPHRVIGIGGEAFTTENRVVVRIKLHPDLPIREVQFLLMPTMENNDQEVDMIFGAAALKQLMMHINFCTKGAPKVEVAVRDDECVTHKLLPLTPAGGRNTTMRTNDQSTRMRRSVRHCQAKLDQETGTSTPSFAEDPGSAIVPDVVGEELELQFPLSPPASVMEQDEDLFWDIRSRPLER